MGTNRSKINILQRTKLSITVWKRQGKAPLGLSENITLTNSPSVSFWEWGRWGYRVEAPGSHTPGGMWYHSLCMEMVMESGRLKQVWDRVH